MIHDTIPVAKDFEKVRYLVDLVEAHNYHDRDSGAYKYAYLFPELGLVLKRDKRGGLPDGIKYDDLLAEIAVQDDERLEGVVAKYVAWGEVGRDFWAVQPMLERGMSVEDRESYFSWAADIDCQFNAGTDESGAALAFDWGYEYRGHNLIFKRVGNYYVNMFDEDEEDDDEV